MCSSDLIGPFTGADTGACKVACDAPTKPAFKFPTCCPFGGKDTGTCVPTSNVPADQQGSLMAGTCPTADAAAKYLGVPNEYLPSAPVSDIQKCTAQILGIPGLGEAGACVSKCANTSLGGVIFTQADCNDSNHICIGCNTAKSQGMAVPGCPP